MNNSTGQSPIIALTDRLLQSMYGYGDFESIFSVVADDIVCYGSSFLQYYVGVEQAKRFLQDEYNLVAPCRIVKMRFREKKTADGATVQANIILGSFREKAYTFYRALFMYRSSQDGRQFLVGVHIVHDIHHESTYNLISSKMLNQQVEEKLSREHDKDLVLSHVECAYVSYIMDTDRSMDFYGEELWQMLGYASEKEFDDKAEFSLMSLVYEQDRRRIQIELTRQLLSREIYQMEYRMLDKSGELIWILECGRRMINEKTGRTTFNSLVINITPLKQTSENLIYRTSYDDLTGIYNKVVFYKKAQEMLFRHPDIQFDILRINIERFKVINDLFGEEMGDRLLKHIAYSLESLDLPLYVCGRLQSDHFVLCYSITDITCEKLVEEIKARTAEFELGYRIILDFGVYHVVSAEKIPVSVMCDRANMALHKVKGNYLVAYGEYDDKMRQHLVAEQAIVNEMNGALERQEFTVYLQPKYELHHDQIIGAEALVRWIHPQRGFISPGEFIPVFERNGFISKLDRYVWEETCRLLRKWLDAGHEPMPISVNVSRVDLYNCDLEEILVALLQKYNLPARLLELEITESAYMDNPHQIVDITNRLQAKGFVILMDDFGSGYSSLNMLKDVPVDVLKIDLKFLDSKDNAVSNRGNNILNSVVLMAKWLHMPVIAEGVETKQQVDFLKQIGCDNVQGYYFSRPVSVETYEEMVRIRGEKN